MSALPTIPPPPEALADPYPPRFEPAPELGAWLRETIIDGGAPLCNPDHRHLRFLDVGFLWTNVGYRKQGRWVRGEARVAQPTGSNDWLFARQELQLRAYFPDQPDARPIPDFLITLDARYVMQRLADGDPAAVLALLEHELYHCAQKTRDGLPVFGDDGRPKPAIRPHDVEEFHRVARRYGAATPALRGLAQALEEGPTVAPAEQHGVCGTCGAAL